MPQSHPTRGYVIDRILVPVDGSPRSQDAVEASLALAGAPSHITLLHIVDSYGLGGDESLATLDALARRVQARCPASKVDTSVRDGDPVEEILGAAERVHPDLIVMATREFLAPSVRAADTVCARVAAHTQIPVMIVGRREGKPPPATPPLRLVVPLDGSLRSLQALLIAAGIARALDATVHLVTVIDPTVSLPPAYAFSCPDCDPELQDALVFLECQANGMLGAAERSLRRADITVTSELLSGRVAPSLLEVLTDGDIVVMTTRGEGRHTGAHVGSIAARLLRDAPVPVIVFHPHLATTITHNPLATDWESAIPPHLAARR